MSKHHDTPAWLRAIQRDGGPVWHHEQGDSAPYQGRAVPLREVGSARAPGCFAKHRAPQHDAEAGCAACGFEQACWKTFSMNPTHKAPRAAGDPAEPAETACPDPVVAKTCALLLSRSAVGVRKYGTTLAANPLSMREWLVHLRDELLDGALYAQRAIDELDAKETQR